jgi:hypothetical protein
MKVYDSLSLCTKYVRNFMLKVIHIFSLPACVYESWKEGVNVHLSAQFTFCFYHFMYMLIKPSVGFIRAELIYNS